MSEVKHTPGPWELGAEHHESEGKTWLTFSHQREIYPPTAKPGEEQHAGPIASVSTAEGDGNAHLIAAAPDLLAALEELLAVTPAFRAKPVGAIGSEARKQQEAHIAAEDKARTAIAKAKGA